MSEEKKKLVIVIACGLEDEKMSVAWSIANGGIKSGLDVTIFLTSSAVDCVRKGAADKVHLNPLDLQCRPSACNPAALWRVQTFEIHGARTGSVRPEIPRRKSCA